MTRARSALLWIVPALALLLPPFLLVPMAYRLPGAQLFKDAYEACLWLTPGVGIVVLAWIWRLRRAGADRPAGIALAAALTFASLDLVAPVVFYVILAILAGH